MASSRPSRNKVGAARQVEAIVEWAKKVLAELYIQPNSSGCEALCGVGTDVTLFSECSRFLGLEYMEKALVQARSLWAQHPFPPNATFEPIDLMKYDVRPRKFGTFDTVGCFGKLSHCFVDQKRAVNFLNNVSELLSPGGIFMGFALDSATVWGKARDVLERDPTLQGFATHPTACVVSESELFTVEFAKLHKPSPVAPTKINEEFGSKYRVHVASNTTHSQYLIHTPTLVSIAARCGLKCIQITNLVDFFQEHKHAFVLELASDLTGAQLELMSLFSVFAFAKQ